MVILTSVMATGALTLTACGSRDDKGGNSDSGGGTTLTIGVDAPLSGENSTTGLGIQYGAQIAVDDANKNKLVPGVTSRLTIPSAIPPSLGDATELRMSPT